MRLALIIAFLTAFAIGQDDLSRLRAAAERGDPKAQNELGIAYQWGGGVPKDYEQAAKWFQAAARQNYPSAQFNLGVMYLEGQHFSADTGKALAWFTLALDNGEEAARDPIRRLDSTDGDELQNTAFVTLGRLLLAGDQVPANPARAVYFLKLAADHKDAFAELTLCQLYIEGNKVVPEPETGRRYCESAMQHHSPVAGPYLGVTLVEGKLMPQDKEGGHRVLLKSAEDGAPLAFYALGMFEQQGTFGSTDPIEAYKWLALGDYFGCSQCGDPLRQLQASLSDADKKAGLKRAQEWDKKHHPPVLTARRKGLVKK